MAKTNGDKGKRIEHKKGEYVCSKVERKLDKSLELIANYQIQNSSKPTNGIYYQNGIGLIPHRKFMTLGIIPRENQIPIILGGINNKGMLTLIYPYPNQFDNTYLRLVSLYENNSQLEEEMKKEREYLQNIIYSNLGIFPQISKPKNSLDIELLLPGFRIKLESTKLEGRIISKISPLLCFDFKIPNLEPELVENAKEELAEINIKYLQEHQYRIAA